MSDMGGYFMKAEDIYLLQLLGERNTQFIIPVYQRTYDWKQDNCKQLIEDIIRVGQDDSIKVHFLGSIVHIIEDERFQINKPRQLVIIDGQQRLTTISLLVLAICRYLQNNKLDINLSKDLYVNYLVNERINGDKYTDHFIKLLLTKGDKEYYTKLIRNEDIESLESNIIRNYNNLYEYIHSNNIDINTICNGLSKLMIVSVSLKRDQDRPQAIFESLNSTGLNLTQADLIRNYILMDLDLNLQKDIFERYWFPIEQRLKHVLSDFIRHYLTLVNEKIPIQNSVYEDFKRTFPKDKINVSEVMHDLYMYSKLYEKMVKQNEDDPLLNKYWINLEKLDVNVVYPLMLKLYSCYEKGNLTKNDFVAIFKLIESYILRRLICGLPTHSLKNVFLSIIKNLDENNYVDSIEKILMSKKGQSKFPVDDEFKSNFLTRDIYNIKINTRKYIFEQLENYNSKEIVNIENCTIEHIMPQNPRLSDKWRNALGSNWKEIQRKYVHTIGNLTLTEHNSEMGDKFFLEKKDICFSQSSIRMNQDLKSITTWNESEIIKRANRMIDHSLNIWTLPDIAEEPNDNRIIYFDEDWSGKKPSSFMFIDESFNAKNFADLYRKVIDILYELDDEKFLFLIEQEEFRNRKFCSRNTDEFINNSFTQISTSNIYLNTNLSSNAKKKNLQLILDKFELDEQELVIYSANE
jgi:uncharacterized protein with ParB-like and HNH nuclease domain